MSHTSRHSTGRPARRPPGWRGRSALGRVAGGPVESSRGAARRRWARRPPSGPSPRLRIGPILSGIPGGPAPVEAVRAAILVVLAFVAIDLLLPVLLAVAGSARLP